MMALLEPGDEVLFPDPGFPIYESMIRFLECVPVPLNPTTRSLPIAPSW